MTGTPPDRRPETEAAAAARKRREAEALRANLARRKAQTRERATRATGAAQDSDGDKQCR